MAKKTPSKSTAKKKAATKKKSAAQKKAAAKKDSVAPKKATPKKSDAVKTTPKKTAAKKETAKTTKKKIPNKKPVKKKETAKTSAKKRPAKKPAAPSKKKAVSIPELLKLKFESWQPEKLIKVAPDKTFQQEFTAPPAVDTDDKKEADRIKALLAKTFDLTVSDVKKEPVVKDTKAPDLQEKRIDETKAEKAVTEPEPAKETEKPVVELEKKAEEPAPEKPVLPQPEQKETVPPIPPAPALALENSEPGNSALKILIATIAGVFALLIIASTMNTDNYYLKPAKNALEIWQGDFSPNGIKLIMSIPGATIPEPVKSKYTRAEALLFAFNYYISEADAAAGKKTIKGYDAALKHLKQAAALHNIDKSRKELLAKKISAIKGAKNNLIKKSSKKKQPKKSSKKKIIKGARHTSQKTATKI